MLTCLLNPDDVNNIHVLWPGLSSLLASRHSADSLEKSRMSFGHQMRIEGEGQGGCFPLKSLSMIYFKRSRTKSMIKSALEFKTLIHIDVFGVLQYQFKLV